MLKLNLLHALKDFPGVQPHFDFGRFLLDLPEDIPIDEIIDRVKSVIGIAHFSVAYRGSDDIEVLKEQVYDKIKNYSFESFRIKARRADKSFYLNSTQINEIVGARVVRSLHKKVDLKNPALTCHIEIFNNKVYFYFERHQGIRGLPVGSSGKVVSLLSAGIDSPVASYRMMTRGCKVIFVHFHSFPFTEKTSYYNAISLAKMLTKYQYRSHIYLIPLAQIQQAIIPNAPAKLRLILYRRMMLRLAEAVAQKEKAKALVTGDSVGQVASQTLENIAAISQAVTIPILRPLVGLDKESIIEQAKGIDTFKTSIEPCEDSCSYLVPKNPETKAKIAQVLAAEEKIGDIRTLTWEALKQTEMIILSYP